MHLPEGRLRSPFILYRGLDGRFNHSLYGNTQYVSASILRIMIVIRHLASGIYFFASFFFGFREARFSSIPPSNLRPELRYFEYEQKYVISGISALRQNGRNFEIIRNCVWILDKRSKEMNLFDTGFRKVTCVCWLSVFPRQLQVSSFTFFFFLSKPPWYSKSKVVA